MLKKKQVKPTESEENIVEQAEPTEVIEEREEKSEWQVKAEEYLVDLKRIQADFENYKKRQAESQKELKGMLIENLVLDIVPVLDNFRQATEHVPAEQRESPWVVGIQYIEKQLEAVLTDNGMQVIEVKEGDAFDTTIHEAVDSQQSTNSSQQKTENEEQLTDNQEKETGESQPHVVVKVLQKGFKLGDKVIRPAKVIVS